MGFAEHAGVAGSRSPRWIRDEPVEERHGEGHIEGMYLTLQARST